MLKKVKIILLITAGIAAGYFLGKGAIDSLVDSDIGGFIKYAIAAVLCVAAVILFIIFDKEQRLGWGIGLIGLIGCFFFGFYGIVYINASTGLHVKWDDDVGIVVKDLIFDEERPETGYDLYLPAEKNSSGKYSLIMYVHGGGFSAGDKEDGAIWCKYMTSKGYVSASINYTLNQPEHKSNLHLMARQVLKCVSAAKAECEKRGYPVTEMAISGGSAGGAIALLYAYGLVDESPVPLKFIFEQTGPAMFDPVAWGETNYEYDAQAEFITAFSGEEVTVDMIKSGQHYMYIEEMSPALLVNENTVPTLCAYGPRDKMVPANLKYYLFEALEYYHVPYDFVEYPHSNHGLYDDPDAQRVFLEKLDGYCEKYFEN